MFNPSVIESINLYTAAYPSSIGEGLSGALWVKTLEPSKDKWHGNLTLDAAPEILLHGPLGKDVAVLFQARRTITDFIFNAFINADKKEEEQKNVFPYLFDSMFKLVWDIDPSNHLQFLYYGSTEGLTALGDDFSRGASEEAKKRERELNFNEDINNFQFNYTESNFIASLKVTHHFSSKNYLTATSSVVPSFGHYKRNSGLSTFDIESKTFPYQFTFDFSSTLDQNHQLNFGVFTYHYFEPLNKGSLKTYYIDTDEGQWTNTTSQFETKNYHKNHFSAYFNDDWSLGSFLHFQWGLRGVYYEVSDEWQIQPRGSVQLEGLGLSWFYRAGYYTRNFLDRTRGIALNPLPSEKAIHQVAGIEKRFGRFYILSEVFLKNYSSLRESNGLRTDINSGQRDVLGFDLYFLIDRRAETSFNAYGSYTYVHALEVVTKRDSDNLFTGALPEVGEEFRPDFLRQHTLSLFLEVIPFRFLKTKSDFLNHFAIITEFKYLSGRPYTPAKDVTQHEIPTQGRRYEIVYDRYHSRQTPDIFLINIQFNQFINKNFSSFVSFQNILSARNVLSVNYGIKENFINTTPVAITTYQKRSLGKEALREIETIDSSGEAVFNIRGGSFAIFFKTNTFATITTYQKSFLGITKL